MPSRGQERRLRLTVSYDGTNFHGWQVQPGLITIQSELQRAFFEISKTMAIFEGSGRTDAGVHALGQVATLSTCIPIPCANLRRAMNRVLPGAIRVTEVEEVAPRFHARFDAVSKLYEYRIYREEICPPFERPYVHHYPYPLDESRIMAAAELFVGEHDFSAFTATDEKYRQDYSTVRRIFSSAVVREGPLLIYRVRGSGFLKHMVRNLVGTLIEVGKRNMAVADVGPILKGAPRAAAGPTAPPSGLFLVEVNY